MIRNQRTRGTAVVCIASLVGLSGCTERYLVPDGLYGSAMRVADDVRPRIAIPAVRESDRKPVWLLADQVVPEGPSARLPGYRHASELSNNRRLSPAAFATFFAGVVGLGLAGVFTQTASCSGGALPCVPGSGDFVVPLATVGGMLLFTGGGLSIARAADHHPAEPDPRNEEIIYVRSPVVSTQSGPDVSPEAATVPPPPPRSPSSPERTPIE